MKDIKKLIEEIKTIRSVMTTEEKIAVQQLVDANEVLERSFEQLGTFEERLNAHHQV